MDLIRENIVMISYNKGPINFHLLYGKVEINFHNFLLSEMDFGGLFLYDIVKLWNLIFKKKSESMEPQFGKSCECRQFFLLFFISTI